MALDGGNDHEAGKTNGFIDITSGAMKSHLSSFSAASLQQALSGNQPFPFLDPNVILMSNAAATIAAVAASAVQQVNNQGGVLPTPSQVGVGAALTPALLAALRNAAASTANSGPSISPQMAAILTAAAGGAGGAGNHALQLLQGTSSSVNHQLHHNVDNVHHSARVASQLHLLLHKESPKNHPPTVNSSSPVATFHASNHSGMQNWNAAQLDKHVSLLKQMNQPIPQSVALLLADAQRKEKKKTAKRAANRKSASTSRARKKALVEEMTRTNARLKRQALILALLPDLVIATSLDGEVNFCSAQVERILGHKSDDMIGVQLDKVLVPSSKDALQKLFKRLVSPSSRATRQGRRGTKRRHNEQEESGVKSDAKDDVIGNGGVAARERSSLQSGDANSGNSGTNSGGAAMISETSFPLSVVEVESKQRAGRHENNIEETSQQHTNSNENSDNSSSNNSGSKQHVSSLSNSQSPVDCPSEDNGAQGGDKESKRAKNQAKGKDQASSGDDSYSSLSSKAENMRKANENLDRNVRRHNQRLMGDSQKALSDDGPKDDVTGASVTANNASARLSSLKHYPSPAVKKNETPPSRYENDQSSSDDSLLAGVEEKGKVGDKSDDSGYRESNVSREETSSSGSDSSNIKKLRRPLAATIRLCLIRADLTTVWCEVTSSLRTRTPEEEPIDLDQFDSVKSPDSFMEDSSSAKKELVQEFLLCFRPIRDGDKKADESFRLFPSRESFGMGGVIISASSANDSNRNGNSSSEKTSEGSDSKNTSASSGDTPSSRPPKKRSLEFKLQAEETGESSSKKQKFNGPKKGTGQGCDTEQTVVESLMLMNKSQKIS